MRSNRASSIAETRHLAVISMQNSVRPRQGAVVAMLAVGLLVSACNSPRSPSSPELTYRPDAERVQDLLVPPDLTEISDGEQFILPGTGGGKVTRNTLLPAFEQARLVRQGAERWLEIAAAPEDVWPILTDFLRERQYPIEQTEPVAGVITTQWRAAGAVQSAGLILSLIGKEETLERVAFRLERSTAGQTRLFSRFQSATPEQVEATTAEAWPADAVNSEDSSALLGRLLAYLGVSEQRRAGVLSTADASAILSDAVLQAINSGTVVLLNKGFVPSFAGVSAALGTLGYTLGSVDADVGRIEVSGKQGAALVLNVAPVHASAVRVSVSDTDGRRLPQERERSVLQALQEALA